MQKILSELQEEIAPCARPVHSNFHLSVMCECCFFEAVLSEGTPDFAQWYPLLISM